MTPLIPIRWALEQPDLLEPILGGESWAAWRTLLIAAMGEPLLTDAERTLFRELTGRECEPGAPVDELWACIGRRGGKTRAAAVMACYLAVFGGLEGKLVRGEQGVIAVLAPTVWQSQRAFSYIKGVLEAVPAFRELVVRSLSDEILLSNGLAIECRPASFRTIRGASLVACIADELAYWWNEENSKNPDRQILDAVRPPLSVAGGPLIVISSPYAKSGELWNTFRRHWGPDGDSAILVAKAASRVMNPTMPEAVVKRAYERDAAAARADFDAEFRSDVQNFVDAEVVEGLVDRGVTLRQPVRGLSYFGAVDPSGGSGQDSMTCCIGHRERDGRVVIDCLLEARPPFSPQAEVRTFAQTLKVFGVHRVVGDRWGGEFVVESWRACGIQYTVAELAKSDCYRDLLPILNSGQISLLDNPRLIGQLCALERRTARGGKDSFDHPRGAHDDLANVVALCVALGRKKGGMKISNAAFERLMGGDTWYGQVGESAGDRWQRAEREAKKLHKIRLDSDDPIPEKFAYMGASSFRVGG